MSDLALDSFSYTVRLTNQQQAFLATILPKGYSLQPLQSVSVGRKNIASRRINTESRQLMTPEKEIRENKRSKIKSLQQIEPAEKKNTSGKRDQIAKRAIIVKKLKKYDYSWPFRAPVDLKALLIPNYNQIVLTPMDLQTIEERIKNDKYEHPSEIERDINQMLLNSYKFNVKESQYFQATSKLQEYYQSLLHQQDQNGLSKKQLPDRQKKKDENQHSNGHEGEKTNQILQFQKDLAVLLKKANELSGQKQVRQKPVYVSLKNDGPISLKEKRELIQQIKSLDESHLSRIIQIIKQVSKNENDHKIDERTQIFSIDVQKLDNRTIKQLQNYVRLQKNSVVHDRQESMGDSHEHNYSVC